MILSAMATPTSPGILAQSFESDSMTVNHVLSSLAADRSFPQLLTNLAINAADTSNQVSWQSAFWALVPIALNSMSQPSGKVLGFQQKYGFFLNSSPIVCVANALELIFKLTWRSLSMRSLDEATRSVADDLFGNDESLERPNKITRLQEMKAVRLILFCLGALPQVVKLCAMRGIVRTQICALLFLGSFTVIEAIMLWLRKYRAAVRDRRTVFETPNNNKLEMIRGLLICTGHSSAIGLVAATSAELAKPKTTLLTLVLPGTLSASIAYTLCLFPPEAFLEEVAPQESDEYRIERIVLVLFVMVSCGSIFLMIALQVNGEFYIKAAIIFFWNLVSAFLIGDSDKSFWTAGGDYFVDLRPSGYILFMLLQLLAALRTYAFNYDPTNTYKPGWTNKLG